MAQESSQRHRVTYDGGATDNKEHDDLVFFRSEQKTPYLNSLVDELEFQMLTPTLRKTR